MIEKIGKEKLWLKFPWPMHTLLIMFSPDAHRVRGCVKIKSNNRIIGPNIFRPRIYGGCLRDLSHRAIKRFTIYRKYFLYYQKTSQWENLAMLNDPVPHRWWNNMDNLKPKKFHIYELSKELLGTLRNS